MDKLSIIFYAVAVLGALGILFGLILAIAARVFAVETDPRQEAILEVLPGANCGGCGFAGCSAYAVAVVGKGAPVNRCAPGGSDTATKIADIMGVSSEGVEKTVAFVRCSGGNHAMRKYIYNGLEDCQAAVNAISNGPVSCEYGCVGFGNCVKACAFGALSIVEGVAYIDPELCTGCMACKNTCPKKIIEQVPYNSEINIPCLNQDKGSITRKVCDSGCMGCRLCERNCPHNAVHVENNHAVKDYSKCEQCGTCVLKCPRHLIKDDHHLHKTQEEAS